MKTKIPSLPLFSLAAAALVAIPSARSADVIQVANNAEWNLATTWDDGAAPVGGNDYFTSNDLGVSEETLRGPFGGATFEGGSLTIVSGSRLLTKGSGTSTFTISNLILDGGRITHGDANPLHILAGGLNVASSSEITLSRGTGQTKSFQIDSIMTGGGNLTLTGGGPFVLNASGSSYSGTFLGVSNVITDFNQSYAASSLNLASGSMLQLDGGIDLTFANVTFGATTLAPGTYTYAFLNSTYDAFLVDGGSGSLTVAAVPEPTTTALLIGAGLTGLILVRRRRAARA